MKRVCVICEGQTEETFIREILAPNFSHLNLYLIGQTVSTSRGKKGGALNYPRLKSAIERTLKQRSNPYVTTLIDLYQLDTSFPSFVTAKNLPLAEKLSLLTKSWHEDILTSVNCKPEQFLPYIQAHEFEALLFSDIDGITSVNPQWKKVSEKLQDIKNKAQTPEYINKNPETTPAAHLKQLLKDPSYRKIRHGSIAMKNVGLSTMQQECLFFAQWLEDIRNFPNVKFLLQKRQTRKLVRQHHPVNCLNNNMTDNIQRVKNYHTRTKHSLQQYAKGPASIDWSDQPDGFRHFTGCEIIKLPKPGVTPETLYSELDRPDNIPPQPLTLPNLGLLLELAFGISAWKEYGPDRWALRNNPSSGNLHPTEAYVISDTPELLSGVYHYVSVDHHLEKRCQFETIDTDNTLHIALSSVHWREAWKYGERAFRYCQHDTGHALAALNYAAAILGWRVSWVQSCSDQQLSHLLGLNRTDDFLKREEEFPDLICRIHLPDEPIDNSIEPLLTKANAGLWFGKAKTLGAYHMYHWKVIDEVSIAAEKPETERVSIDTRPSELLPTPCHKKAADIIRQRRSAQHFDGKSTLPLDSFLRMLSATLPSNPSVFQSGGMFPNLHLCLFVHRVENLPAGLYTLIRNESGLRTLQESMDENFQWQKQHATLPFYQLLNSDCKKAAKTLSCHQTIASDSAFSLGMIAEFADNLDDAAWNYRRLFWESGMIGQALYLEAEAAGVRGTGIGCYFDDSVHEVLGIKGDRLQSLYHFTIGVPLTDTRIQTLPPYAHLEE